MIVGGCRARTRKDQFRTRANEWQRRLARPLGCGERVLGLGGFFALVHPRRLSHRGETAADTQSTQIHDTRWGHWGHANLIAGRQGWCGCRYRRGRRGRVFGWCRRRHGEIYWGRRVRLSLVGEAIPTSTSEAQEWGRGGRFDVPRGFHRCGHDRCGAFSRHTSSIFSGRGGGAFSGSIIRWLWMSL